MTMLIISRGVSLWDAFFDAQRLKTLGCAIGQVGDFRIGKCAVEKVEVDVARPLYRRRIQCVVDRLRLKRFVPVNAFWVRFQPRIDQP